MCIIDQKTGLYIIVDYFPDIEGAPLLGIMQVRKDVRFSKSFLPEYIQVYKEVTDASGYSPEKMCLDNYTMDQNDRLETNAI